MYLECFHNHIMYVLNRDVPQLQDTIGAMAGSQILVVAKIHSHNYMPYVLDCNHVLCSTLALQINQLANQVAHTRDSQILEQRDGIGSMAFVEFDANGSVRVRNCNLNGLVRV